MVVPVLVKCLFFISVYYLHLTESSKLNYYYLFILSYNVSLFYYSNLFNVFESVDVILVKRKK